MQASAQVRGLEEEKKGHFLKEVLELSRPSPTWLAGVSELLLGANSARVWFGWHARSLTAAREGFKRVKYRLH